MRTRRPLKMIVPVASRTSCSHMEWSQSLGASPVAASLVTTMLLHSQAALLPAAESMTPTMPLVALLIMQQLTETTLAAWSLRSAGDQGALSNAYRHQKGKRTEINVCNAHDACTKDQVYLLHMQCPACGCVWQGCVVSASTHARMTIARHRHSFYLDVSGYVVHI